MLFQMCFYRSELLYQLVVLENLQVFNVIISLVIAFKLLSWLSRVNSFQDADSTEIFESDLHSPNGIATRKVLSLLALLSFLYSFSHISLGVY